MNRLMKKIPFHTFLIAPALIFFLYVHNLNTASFSSTIRSYVFAVSISIFLFIAFYFLLRRNKYKAGVVSTTIILILFFYGFIYELAERLFYKGWWPFNEIHRYLILTIFILISLLIYFLFRTKRTFISLSYSLNIFVLFLILINVFQFLISFSKPKESDAFF